MIAHVGGVPVEEALLPLMTGVGIGLLLVRTWAVSHLGRPRRAGVSAGHEMPVPEAEVPLRASKRCLDSAR